MRRHARPEPSTDRLTDVERLSRAITLVAVDQAHFADPIASRELFAIALPIALASNVAMKD